MTQKILSVSGNESASELALKAINALSEKESDVLKLYYGLGETHRHSIEETGASLDLHPDETAKLRKKAIRRLRLRATRSLIIATLKCGEQEIWAAMAAPNGIVYKASLQQTISKQLPGELQIAIECVLERVSAWLSANSRETPIAWYRSKYSELQIEELMKKIASRKKELRLPMPVQSMAEIFDIEVGLLQIAVLLGKNYVIYRDYVGDFPMGSRAVRGTRLHQVLSGKSPHSCLSLRELMWDYKRIFSDDDCSVKDIEFSMAQAQHLFLPMGEKGWTCVNPISENGASFDPWEENTPIPKSAEQNTVFFKWSAERKNRGGKNVREVIQEILENKGICHQSDITDEFSRITKDKYSNNTSISILRQFDDDEFIVLAPEFYGLRDKEYDINNVTQFSHLLLNKRSCFQYVIARHAGEPMDIYPLWTPTMEKTWCEWAEREVPQRLFDSLLSVVDPSRWPYKDADITQWVWKKQCFGHYHLEQKPRYQIWKQPPILLRVLMIAKYACRREFITWVGANRVLGINISSHLAASILALMVGLRALTPDGHWQRPHTVSEDVNRVISLLQEELHLSGSLEWQGEAGKTLLNRLSKNNSDVDLGWVDSSALKALVTVLLKTEKTSRASKGRMNRDTIP